MVLGLCAIANWIKLPEQSLFPSHPSYCIAPFKSVGCRLLTQDAGALIGFTSEVRVKASLHVLCFSDVSPVRSIADAIHPRTRCRIIGDPLFREGEVCRIKASSGGFVGDLRLS